MSDAPTAGVIGASGFLGGLAASALAANGWRVTGFRRRAGGDVPAVSEWRDAAALDVTGMRAVVNLAGEPINRRWTEENRARMAGSRAGVTRRVVEAIGRLPAAERPEVLVNASAVGIYGDRGDESLDERATLGGGYLAELCREWEEAAGAAECLGTRVVRLRIGMVLGRNGAAYRRLERLFRCGLGGRLGSGRQWWAWVHAEDFAAAVVACIEGRGISGPVNVVAPEPATNAEFTRALARAVRRPAVLPVPGIALKVLLGGFGGVLLASQRVVPRVLQEHGFRFRHGRIDDALRELGGAKLERQSP